MDNHFEVASYLVTIGRDNDECYAMITKVQDKSCTLDDSRIAVKIDGRIANCIDHYLGLALEKGEKI